MDIVDYPFIKAGAADSRPALFIRLTSPRTGRVQDTTGLIDTGVFGCCVPISYAEILGLAPESDVKRTVRTASGTTTAYEHNCGIKVWDTHEFFKGNKVLVYELSNMRILFMEGLTDILLGIGFLNEKVLTIDYRRKCFSLRKS